MFSDNAYKVLNKRYFLRDQDGQISEDVDQLFSRVARCVAAVEERWQLSPEAIDELSLSYKRFMLEQEFMPNSPTLMNAGKPGGQLSACFVLPVPDSLEGIFETCKNAALIHKTGGGTGFSFSRIRPHNDRVAHSVGVASGPVSFMMVYDAATEAIRQGGTRRGANMGMLRIDHPDIEQFINCKRDTSKLNNFNISVAITDKFMQAVKEDDDFDLVHPSRLVQGRPEVIKSVRARELFETLVQNAHATGEPGMVFIDRINTSDPLTLGLDPQGKPICGTEDIEATNPCGEQPLGPGDACNLGSINLVKFIGGDGKGKDFDWSRLGKAISLAVRFLDDVIDANRYPFDFIESATLNNRRIGLGIMGWAEALILLGIAYDSVEAVSKAEQLGQFFQEKAHQASHKLAEARGNFPNWQHSSWAKQGVDMRNATVTTIAPTGTISIIAGTSSGIEPLFAVSFLRRVLGGMEMLEVNPIFESLAKAKGFYSPDLMHRIASQGTVSHIEEIPADIRRLWVCAHDIDYIWHVRMQAAFQKHIDNAVSKTINFPYEATPDQVRDAYMAAWDLNLKGITVYRDRSRSGQVLNIQKDDSGQIRAEAEEMPKKSRSVGLPGTVTSPPTRGALALAISKPPQASAAAVLGTMAISYICEELCSQCGEKAERFLKYEACRMCPSCGYTKC